jgi:branched-chain amino acid aminotransferase
MALQEEDHMSIAMFGPQDDLPEVTSHHHDPRNYPHGIAFMDGQYLPMSYAKVSVHDWSFLHSDATYVERHPFHRIVA